MCHDNQWNPEQGVVFVEPLSMRDRLAGMAMQGVCSNIPSDGREIDTAKFARFSYEVADAMIAESGKVDND